ncbi:hypothetical protein, variant 1 [Aphanomyces invadans]|uniref:Uncharacterized protein n=1 Tax=Aphanomyces invadans TaxID=157072 RepID=A0A024TB26_9STRA|nr:hypothetical protein, variant 1 [Aphanomyces invadans]ETV91248.1 hypothetical protein, variant 1 [Aphanomyces invadans]|eukprot:XP_008880085.1 hypothetical protein, variant 1 [Aphanomyces invadans]
MSKDALVARKNAREHQLRQVYATVEGYVPTYEDALNTLEKHLQLNMTPDAVGQWFDLYVRVVDLSVEIRRGEIRHRTERKFLYKSRTKTCRATATTNGLGIDDGNALINELDSIYKQLKKRKPMQLDTLESQLDILDRDTLGPLDKRISEVKRRLEGLQSAYYTSCSLIVHGDIHVELIIRQDSTVLLQKKRRCDDITTCSCPVDAAPWVNFMINPSTIPAKPTVQPKAVTVVPDVNLNDLKKSYGVDVEERERNLESFQNEVDYGVVIADETSSHCDAQLFPPSKRARRPPPEVSPIYDPPDNMNLSCPKTNAGIKQEHGDLIQVILATGITPTPSAGGAHCSVQYGDIVSWGSIPRKSRIQKVLDAVATTSMCIHTWTMHDMDVSVDEMTTFVDAITADSSALQPLAALNARSINFDPSKWAMPLHALTMLPALQHVDLSYNTLSGHGPAIEALLTQCTKLTSINLEQCGLRTVQNHVLAGLAACATAGQLKRLSLADNAFKRAFLVKLFQTLQGLELHMLNLRFVMEETDAYAPSEVDAMFEFDQLRVRHLHLDFSMLITDTSFLAALAKAVGHSSCGMETLEMPSWSNPLTEPWREVMNQVAAYGRIRRLNVRGLSCTPLSVWEDVLRSGVKQCVALEWTVSHVMAEVGRRR